MNAVIREVDELSETKQLSLFKGATQQTDDINKIDITKVEFNKVNWK